MVNKEGTDLAINARRVSSWGWQLLWKAEERVELRTRRLRLSLYGEQFCPGLLPFPVQDADFPSITPTFYRETESEGLQRRRAGCSTMLRHSG